jgi:hypothetical protein
MPQLAKTIQIFLPDGDARSIRIAEITSRTVGAVQIPRAKLKDGETGPEINCVGVYYLFGEPEDGTSLRVYVGEAEDLCSRLKTTRGRQGLLEHVDRGIVQDPKLHEGPREIPGVAELQSGGEGESLPSTERNYTDKAVRFRSHGGRPPRQLRHDAHPIVDVGISALRGHRKPAIQREDLYVYCERHHGSRGLAG